MEFTRLESKVITERLNTVRGKLVDAHQMAFLRGRQIMKCCSGKWVGGSRTKSDKSGVLCELDTEKLYDHVNWGFLLKILKDIGFGDKWD